ncbi:MAG: chemotaxis protein CheX [Deltaproteobacteria bacterium]|nr:chemotaxis protein CheX [Deltaproteobacteria bacterium]
MLTGKDRLFLEGHGTVVEANPMDVRYINPFLYGTIEVLKKMAFLEPRPGKVYLKKTAAADGDVSGIIGITGDMIGSLAISFGESCICHIVGSMLGESFAEANQEVFDGVGEITNMISGVARTHMEKEGMQVYAAIPSVVYGKNHSINHILKSPSIVIPFETDHGTFAVDVCIKKSTEESKLREYRVVNEKTPVPPAESENQSTPEPPPPAGWADKKERIKTKLREITAIRDEILRQLESKPFMEISKRQALKKRIPVLEAQIKRLRLDLSTAEMLSKISEDDMKNPKLVQHYQHYDTGKRKP